MIKKTIQEMSIGEMGIITDMNKIETSVRHRFMDLGLAPKAQVTLLNKINFNRLFIIEVDDVEICIRLQDAKKILIEKN